MSNERRAGWWYEGWWGAEEQSSPGGGDGVPHAARIDQVARAQAIAVVAHRHQVDKLGERYIDHPAAVAAAFDPARQTVEHCAGWLHDVVEDTQITLGELSLAGMWPDVVEVVGLLTREPGQGDEYYERIRANDAARAVKLADIAHNTSPERTARLDDAVRERLEQKYRHALHILTFVDEQR